MVETTKRILTKEKIGRQLARQSSPTPFMSIKDNCNKKVTFDTRDGLEDKIDKLTVMMGKLAARDNGTNRQFKPQIFQSRRRGQSRIFYDSHNYDRGNYQNRYRSNSRDRRIQSSGQSRGRPRYEQNYKRGNFRGNMRTYQNFERQNSGEYRDNNRNEDYSRERGRSRSRERSFSRNINNRMNDKSISNSRSRPGSRARTNRDRIRCYKCREYDHFAKDCPTSKEEREI